MAEEIAFLLKQSTWILMQQLWRKYIHSCCQPAKPTRGPPPLWVRVAIRESEPADLRSTNQNPAYNQLALEKEPVAVEDDWNMSNICSINWNKEKQSRAGLPLQRTENEKAQPRNLDKHPFPGSDFLNSKIWEYSVDKSDQSDKAERISQIWQQNGSF